jgi:peptidyl-prolyl cis-trans isomerase B (cyclophilin B)
MGRINPAASAATPAAQPAMGPSGLPVGLFLGGIIAAAILSIILTLTYYTGIGFRLAVGFDVATLIADSVAVFGIWRAGVAGSAQQGLRILGFVIALLSPVLDVVALATNATNSSYGYYSIAHGAFLLLPITTVLAWILATGLPGRAYFTLFISGGAGLVASFFPFVAGGVPDIVLSTAGVGVAVLVANRIRRRPARAPMAGSAPTYGGASTSTYSGDDAAHTAISRPLTTNGFAVSALIFGLVGGNILPIVFGHVALAQIGRSGERGRGMAVAGLILGYLSLAAVIVIVIVVAVAAANRPVYY